MKALLILALGVCHCVAATANNQTGLALTVKAQEKTHTITVAIRLENNSGQDIAWLGWWMPSDGKLRCDLVEVSDSKDVSVPYTGVQVSFTEPVRSDFKLLKHGAFVEVHVDVSKFYQLQRGHQYKLRVERMLEYYAPLDSAEPTWCILRSNELKVTIP